MQREPPRCLPYLAAALLLALPAHAAPPGQQAARQLAGLFLQSCLPYAGDPPALHAWAHRMGLAQVPDPARRAFLHGNPGQVFDASNPEGKFVVISWDGGACADVAQAANGPALARDLESDLHQAGLAVSLLHDREDPAQKQLRHREYRATKDGRSWRILASWVMDQPQGQAMLTAAVE
jgi:hypothetical protein